MRCIFTSRYALATCALALIVFYFTWPWGRSALKKFGPLNTYRIFESGHQYDQLIPTRRQTTFSTNNVPVNVCGLLRTPLPPF